MKVENGISPKQSRASAAIAQLRSAREAEAKGMAVLEKIVAAL